MTARNRQSSIVAFLDVIACGFGATVLLVLILPVGDHSAVLEGDALDTVAEIEADLSGNADKVTAKRLEIASLKGTIDAALNVQKNLVLDVGAASEISRLEKIVEDTRENVAEQKAELKNEAIRVQESKFESHLYGIPVDSDYLVFVIDTSGSMQKVWPRVLQTIKDILVNYPNLSGFQIISDQGEFLFSRKSSWLSADKTSISLTIDELRAWNAYSNSSPVEGIEVAVRRLFRSGISLGLFVVGDDYTGTDFDGFLDTIDSITSRVGKAGQLRVHALGFYNDQYSQYPERFARLMQVLTFNHGGAFLYIGNERPEPVEISRNRQIPVAD